MASAASDRARALLGEWKEHRECLEATIAKHQSQLRQNRLQHEQETKQQYESMHQLTTKLRASLGAHQERLTRKLLLNTTPDDTLSTLDSTLDDNDPVSPDSSFHSSSDRSVTLRTKHTTTTISDCSSTADESSSDSQPPASIMEAMSMDSEDPIPTILEDCNLSVVPECPLSPTSERSHQPCPVSPATSHASSSQLSDASSFASIQDSQTSGYLTEDVSSVWSRSFQCSSMDDFVEEHVKLGPVRNNVDHDAESEEEEECCQQRVNTKEPKDESDKKVRAEVNETESSDAEEATSSNEEPPSHSQEPQVETVTSDTEVVESKVQAIKRRFESSQKSSQQPQHVTFESPPESDLPKDRKTPEMDEVSTAPTEMTSSTSSSSKDASSTPETPEIETAHLQRLQAFQDILNMFEPLQKDLLPKYNQHTGAWPDLFLKAMKEQMTTQTLQTPRQLVDDPTDILARWAGGMYNLAFSTGQFAQMASSTVQPILPKLQIPTSLLAISECVCRGGSYDIASRSGWELTVPQPQLILKRRPFYRARGGTYDLVLSTGITAKELRARQDFVFYSRTVAPQRPTFEWDCDHKCGANGTYVLAMESGMWDDGGAPVNRLGFRF